ncbi:MAG TPA: MBL fold metallo-hydrolase [Syntrophomonadaceae bacterium]|nr:MBL fold metallo-hydrolase [Syntrophomonadaceae bacterium]
MLLKISDKISLVISELGFTYCNCLLIEDEIRTIIDTGADLETLMNISPSSIDMVLYTHHHYDHTRGHELFNNADSLMHRLDSIAVTDIELFEHYNSIDKWDELMPDIDREVGIEALKILPEEQKPWNVDGCFEDGQIFDLGHTKVQVIHTPGHSAGHSSFWFPEKDFLFTGDICLTTAGPWYGEVYADPDDMISSIDKLIELKPERIATCHVNYIYEENVTERLIEFKNRIYKRDERIFNYLKKQPADIHQLADNNLVYKYHPTPFVLFWEKLMIIKHLARLEKMGMVEEVENSLFVAK